MVGASVTTTATTTAASAVASVAASGSSPCVSEHETSANIILPAATAAAANADAFKPVVSPPSVFAVGGWQETLYWLLNDDECVSDLAAPKASSGVPAAAPVPLLLHDSDDFFGDSDLFSALSHLLRGGITRASVPDSTSAAAPSWWQRAGLPYLPPLLPPLLLLPLLRLQ